MTFGAYPLGFRPIPGHKDLQICRQVHDAISLALADLDDPFLDELSVRSVLPAPNASRLEVTFVTYSKDLDLVVALERVNAVAGDLREEVTAEITRKRAPELVFRVERAPEKPL